MCVLNVKGDYVGLTLCVWHTNSNHITLPVSTAWQEKTRESGFVCVCLERISVKCKGIMADVKQEKEE